MTILLNLDSSPLISVPSTQDLARAAAEDGAPEGTVVRALEQTAGRGRGAHEWHSAPGLGLWMSFLLRPRVEPRYWPGLTALVALATAEAFESFGTASLPSGWRAAIKWPNDLRGTRGKLASILAESTGGAIVFGLGINLGHQVDDFPPELRDQASSLRIEGFSPVPDADAMARAIDSALSDSYARFQSGDRALLQSGLRERFFLRDARVRLRESDSGPEIEGIARDVGPLGELFLETAAGPRTVWSGEVLAFTLPA